MLYITDDGLAPYNSHHGLSPCVRDNNKKGPDQIRYRERPDQSHSAAHSKINQVKSAEKLLKALRGGRIHRSGYRPVSCIESHLGSDLFSGPAQAGPELPGSISSSCIWGLCSGGSVSQNSSLCFASPHIMSLCSATQTSSVSISARVDALHLRP